MGHLGLWVVTGLAAYYLFAHQVWWGFFAALFAHGTVASFFTAPHHELCHTTVFRTKWLNELFLRVFSLIGWLNFHVYRFSHSYHHRYTLFIDGDREEVLPESPSLRFAYLAQLFTVNVTGGYQSRGLVPTLKNFLMLAANRLDNPFNSWGPELYEGHPREGARAVRWARLVLLFHAGVVAASAAAGEPIIAVLVSGSVFIANWLRLLRGRSHALRAAQRRPRLSQVHAHHHPRSAVGVPVLAHELASRTPHVRGRALLQPEAAAPRCRARHAGTAHARRRLAGDARGRGGASRTSPATSTTPRCPPRSASRARRWTRSRASMGGLTPAGIGPKVT